MSADEGESALAFLEERRTEIKTSLRDGLYISVAALRSELFHVRTVDSILDQVEEAEKLDHCTASNIHRARLNVAAYDGRLEAWRRHRTDLLALAPYHENSAVNAVAAAGNLTGIVTSGLYLHAHDDVRTAIAEGSVIADKWGLESYRRYYDAIEAAYELTTGQLGSAKMHFVSALSHSQYLTRVVARTHRAVPSRWRLTTIRSWSVHPRPRSSSANARRSAPMHRRSTAVCSWAVTRFGWIVTAA